MAAPLRDRLSFLSRLPTLLKGTADDEAPCPGYLFEEIAKISHESPGSSQCLLEYLLNRLQSSSCHVKLKVLKILLHTCTHGSPQFILQLKRNAAFIREAAVFTGPPDPLHGNSLNQKVRLAAQDLASVLFSDALLPQPAALPACPLPPAGMGSKSSPCGSLQGFGFSSEKSSSASTGEALLSTIQRAAEAVANAVLPSQEGPRLRRRELHEDTYQPVSAPAPGRSTAGSAKPPAAAAAHNVRVSHQPGLAGGGWEETDSGHSSQDSSQENGELSRTSDSYSKSGSDSHSGASRELANVAERCGLLNCEVVLELLSRALEDPSESVRMRSMCAISSLMCSDLLSLDQIFAVTRQHLQQLSQGSPGPVANRATKILRQFEALCRGQPSPKSSQLDTDPSALAAGSARCTQDLLTDIPPLAGESILEPVSVALLPVAAPARVGEPGDEAEPCGQSGVAVPACPREPEAASRLGGIPRDMAGAAAPSRSLSLFAGMELVARPGTVLSQDSPPAEPRTLSHPGDAGASSRSDVESSREPSAFSFLNM
ncbi:AP-4 complex accessory subunit tepsin isoform X2 [Dromaius novaehollandiae]|uniref:AP-4 complex accessory subunit tepsin isoform X2 n=1 Tax=Dromaius novaehollandiae TaxID=8790 RepID=UPI00311D8C28